MKEVRDLMLQACLFAAKKSPRGRMVSAAQIYGCNDYFRRSDIAASYRAALDLVYRVAGANALWSIVSPRKPDHLQNTVINQIVKQASRHKRRELFVREFNAWRKSL